MLLGHVRSLNEVYQRKFGSKNEHFKDQMRFWDGFFHEEFENKTLIYGNDRNEQEKRVGLSRLVRERLAHLEVNREPEGFENFTGRTVYKQVMMAAPNEVQLRITPDPGKHGFPNQQSKSHVVVADGRLPRSSPKESREESVESQKFVSGRIVGRV